MVSLNFQLVSPASKFKVEGGKLVIVNGYAPHNGHPFDVRQQFYSELAEEYSRVSSYGLKMICGDLNARLLRQLPGEEDIMGDYVFGSADATGTC